MLFPYTYMSKEKICGQMYCNNVLPAKPKYFAYGIAVCSKKCYEELRRDLIIPTGADL